MTMSCYQCPLREVCFQAAEFEREGKKFDAKLRYIEKAPERQERFEEIADQLPEYMSDNDTWEFKIDLLRANALACSDETDKVIAGSRAVLDWSYENDRIRSDEDDCPGPIVNKQRKWYGRVCQVTIECASAMRQERAKIAQEKLYDA